MTNNTPPRPAWVTLRDEFDIFIACADDGNGGDITNGGAPLPTFDEWRNR